jgi:RNA polymerase sigma factor (sigma-70 family)
VEEQGVSFASECPAEDQSAQFTMVMTVLEEQPETTKEIIRLYFFEQMTYQHIADQFGLGVTTVKDRLKKAIGVVQQHVMASCGE